MINRGKRDVLFVIIIIIIIRWLKMKSLRSRARPRVLNEGIRRQSNTNESESDKFDSYAVKTHQTENPFPKHSRLV